MDRKSPGGHVFVTNDGYIAWQSRKQSVIPMATLEAEFITCLGASGAAKWLLELQKDIHGKDLPPPPINCDNQGALTVITMGIIKV